MKSLFIFLAAMFSVNSFANNTMYNTTNCIFASKQNINVPKVPEILVNGALINGLIKGAIR